MRPALASFLFLACCGVLLADSTAHPEMQSKQAPLLQELVRMTRAGSSNAEVLAYAQAHRLELPPQVSSQDLRWLRDSGVSERVVSYMSAYDVRATNGETPQEDSSNPEERPARSRGVYSYPSNAGRDYGSHSSDEYADYGTNGYADGSYDYPCADYGFDSCYDYGYSPYYGYGYPYYDYSYPFYAFGYPYSFGYGYSPYRGFHRRGHRFHGHHRFDGRGFRGGRGGAAGRFAPRDAWRERGFRGSRGGPRVVGPRGSGRSSFGHGGFGRGPRGSSGRAVGPRGFGSPGAPRGGFAGGSRGSQRSFGSPGGFGRGFSRPSFSGGPRIGGGSPGARGRR